MRKLLKTTDHFSEQQRTAFSPRKRPSTEEAQKEYFAEMNRYIATLRVENNRLQVENEQLKKENCGA